MKIRKLLAFVLCFTLCVCCFTGCTSNKPSIEIPSMSKFTTKYYIHPEKNDYCEILVDFGTGTIGINKYTEIYQYVSASDVSGADVSGTACVKKYDYAEEHQDFSQLDLTALEQFLIEKGGNLFTDAYDYNLSEMEDYKILCNITIQTGEGKYYHHEAITSYPDDWNELLCLLRNASGTTLDIGAVDPVEEIADVADDA